MKFIVTIEALKRTTKEVEANTEEEAKETVQKILSEDGVESFEFDEMYDSVKIVSAISTDDLAKEA